ncbi:hypothetical protein SCHPADRAFT_902336 [Schizopora paradoxa]|uniref:F-box domain-containing protein n=1 Tax=Schizopora paradoxa TaxID=27342 RepID=A0A0H2RUB7_9AGAM|nr:hypothetical protein SCHPADRAFT_902336 [Schizopora paradoxa]
MERSSNDVKLSGLWTCHRSIEAFCAQRTEELLHSVDALVAEIRCEVDAVNNPVLMDNNGCAPLVPTSIKDQRDASDRIRMLMHVNSIQLEVLRRATQHKQDEANALATQKSNLTAQIDESRTPSVLPTLPNEIIEHIFSYLYWLEDSRLPDHPADSGTTLQKLLADDDTSDEWKKLINRQIPCLLKTSGADANVQMFGPYLGPHPRVMSFQDLTRETNDIVGRPSTTIVINLSDGMQTTEILEGIRHKPWNDVFISGFGETRASVSPSEVIKSLVEKFGEKLAGLNRLQLVENSWSTFNETFHAYAGASTDASGTGLPPPELAHIRAHLPPRLLPLFRSVLHSVSNLETIIPSSFDSGEMMSDIDALFQESRLALCSNNLSSLTITNVLSSLPSGKARKRRRLSFPRLKHLCLKSFTKGNILDVLGAMDCPSLSHFTLILQTIPPSDMDPREDRECPVTASLLHKMFPNLEFISAGLGELDADAQFLSGLACPDESGNWMLPLLDSMKFQSRYVTFAQLPLLKALTKVVINRLRSEATRDIRYLSIPEFEGAGSGDCDALRLFAPEVHFVPRTYYGRDRPRGW